MKCNATFKNCHPLLLHTLYEKCQSLLYLPLIKTPYSFHKTKLPFGWKERFLGDERML